MLPSSGCTMACESQRRFLWLTFKPLNVMFLENFSRNGTPMSAYLGVMIFFINIFVPWVILLAFSEALFVFPAQSECNRRKRFTRLHHSVPHSPFTSVSPSNSLPHSTRIDPLDIEYQQTKKACVSMERRLHACLPLHLSFRDRTLFLSFYVLSLPHYHHSILLPSETLINHYISLIRKFLCPRHWIQAHHLPGIVSFLKLGILHCPTIFSLLFTLRFLYSSVRRSRPCLAVWDHLCPSGHSIPTNPRATTHSKIT